MCPANACEFHLQNQNRPKQPRDNLTLPTIGFATIRSRTISNFWERDGHIGTENLPHLSYQSQAEVCDFRQNHRAST